MSWAFTGTIETIIFLPENREPSPIYHSALLRAITAIMILPLRPQLIIIHSRFTFYFSGDALSPHNGAQFSTFDADNDRWSGNCASEYSGAWWYTSCHTANLNGVYLGGPTSNYAKGVVWNSWKGYSYSLKFVEIKIRPLPPPFWCCNRNQWDGRFRGIMDVPR